MNKVYNTVWNESTGMWVVTSELTRKGGRRPRQISRTVLAGLIAGLLLPSAPVLAQDYTNVTLEYGTDSVNMNVFGSDTATGTTINSVGRQWVSGGGSATSTTINDGGWQYVMSGGSATSTIINSGGIQDIYGGVVASAIINNGGEQLVSSGGSATDTTINSGGVQDVSSGGSVISTTINSGGKQLVSSGGSATSTTINWGGTQNISSGGRATSTTIYGHGTQNIYRGGSATSTTINSGGYQYIYGEGSATSTIISAGVQFVNEGGSATSTTINDSGIQFVNGGSVTSTIINPNGRQYVSSGTATDTTINSGGELYVRSGGSATGITISSDGELYVDSGGVASQVNQSRGGAIITDTLAVLSGTNVNGSFSISNGSAVNMLLENGGAMEVYYGTYASNTTVGSDSRMVVSRGGVATDTTINSGGEQVVIGGSGVTKTTINSGGMQDVRGGTATDTTINDGGRQYVSGVAIKTTINDGGAQIVSGGGAAETTINSGGEQIVYDGGAAETTINYGGTLSVSIGGSATDTFVNGGTLSVSSGGVLRGTTTLTDKGTLVGDVVTNEGNLYFLNNSAATFAGSLTGTGTLTQEGGDTRFSGLLSQDGGITLQRGAAMTMDALLANVNVKTQSGTTLTLDKESILTGSVAGDNSGAGNMTVKGASVWHLDGDSTVGVLTLDNGTVDFRSSDSIRQIQAFRPVSLVAESLSGNGTFRMNTDIASHSGDMLNVKGNASGNFVLDIRNTGLEPVSAGTPLQVVHTGSGDAAFSLNGGKVDAGTWEYYLNKENTDWYLKADSGQPEPDNPNPGTDNPAPPVRHTTKSADAVLNMATAPVYVFNSELQSLRFRHGDVMQNTRSPGGVWGRYTGSDNRISGGAGSGYSLTQSGMETGGDAVFELNDSRLAVGAFVSYTDNSISHNRGGSGTVGSTGGGLYATWFNNDGYYVDGVIKVNRFRNELRTRMSDGTAVKGDYHQNGFGGSLEAGRTFSLNENTWIQPYLRSTAFRAESKDISLDNGMKAKAGTTKSLQGEVGVNLGMNLDVAGTVVRPYLTTAVSHEFSDNNRVRINDSYDFTNDISGTTGKYGAGVSAQLTANAGVWAEVSYQKGENTESPVTGSVGFRINF
ncbi:autotransporter outer membrane beta-barrel domain-containing protein [Escherichia coli]|nr:autotransporter outer membrane beta-barrel domain-containing protein [Escherichia coli]